MLLHANLLGTETGLMLLFPGNIKLLLDQHSNGTLPPESHATLTIMPALEGMLSD